MKMNSGNRTSTKYLHGITTGKPQLRNNSWAKLLSQNRSYRNGEVTTALPQLHVNCKPVPFNVKQTRKSGYDPVENLVGFVKECDEETDNFKEKRQTEENKIDEELFDQTVEEDSDMVGNVVNDTVTRSQTQYDVSQVPRLTLDQGRGELDHLPPLADFSPSKHEKIPKEEVYLRRDLKVQKGCFPSKIKDDIDWQNIFVNGGFRPYESRDLPTRGELNLLKYKTWDAEGSVYCIARCAKYFGLDSEITKGRITLVEEEPQKRYTSLSPTYTFYPLRAPKRHKSFPPLENSPETLRYLENPAKRYHLCSTCVCPPVTPAPSTLRSSPYGWSPLPYKGRKSTLGQLAEMSADGPTPDEGIDSPTESELEF